MTGVTFVLVELVCAGIIIWAVLDIAKNVKKIIKCITVAHRDLINNMFYTLKGFKIICRNWFIEWRA